MNTTMADGASERLDAQIADALFGQPGMSKLDVANRLRELRGEGAALLVQADGKAAGAAKGALLALGFHWNGFRWERSEGAAHPSPSGQGDALAALQQEYDKLLAAFDRQVDAAEKIAGQALQQEDRIEELEEGLASLQPVAAAVKDSLTVGGGQAWVVADGQGARWRMWGSSGPEWTSDRDQALQFARRADAEAFANDDEDAWLIQAVPNG